MRHEFRLRIRVPRSTASLALVAALLAWPGAVLCPVSQSASVVGYVADEARPAATVTLTTNQTTILGTASNAVITMVPQNCVPAKNPKLFGCTNGWPCQGTDASNSDPLFLPATGGAQYNNNTIGTPSCYNPVNSGTTNPLRRVFLPAPIQPAFGARGEPDIFRFDGDIRVDKLCLWGTCSTYWPLEFKDCSVSGSCSTGTQQCATGSSLCPTSGTRGAIQTIVYDWTIPGSTVPVPMPTSILTGTSFNPWKFTHSLVALTGACGAAVPATPVGTCGGAGCEIPPHLAQGKSDTPPADDATNRLKRTDSVSTPGGVVTVTMNCYVMYPTTQLSQTKGRCTITIPVQFNAASCAKYRFQPTASCTEVHANTPENVANGLYVPCPDITVSG